MRPGRRAKAAPTLATNGRQVNLASGGATVTAVVTESVSLIQT